MFSSAASAGFTIGSSGFRGAGAAGTHNAGFEINFWSSSSVETRRLFDSGAAISWPVERGLHSLDGIRASVSGLNGFPTAIAKLANLWVWWLIKGIGMQAETRLTRAARDLKNPSKICIRQYDTRTGH